MAIPNMAMIPSGYKPTKLYSVLPTPENGSDVITNGDFSTDSNWVKQAGWTISGGSANSNNGGAYKSISQSGMPFQVGKSYKVSCEVSNYVSGEIVFNVGGFNLSQVFAENGVHTEIIQASNPSTNTYLYIESRSSGFEGSVDNVSVEEVLVSDADFTVTRASSATRVNKQGLIETPEFILSGDLVTNGDFSDGSTDWVLGSGWIVANGKASCDGTDTNISGWLRQNGIIVSGKSYKVTFDVTTNDSGIVLRMNDTHSTIANITGSGSKTIYFTSRGYSIAFSQDKSASIDNISIVEVERENIPRLDYTDGGCPVLLTEPQSTNLVPDSSDFSDASWDKVDVLITSDSTISPSGIVDATKLVASTVGTVNHNVKRTVTVSTATDYSVSFFAKKGEYNYVSTFISALGGDYAWDLNNGTVVLGNGKIEDYGNGWFRCIVEGNTTSTSLSYRIYVNKFENRNTSFQGDGISGIYIWGAQLEEKSYSTSYMPTYGQIATRAADQVENGGSSSNFNNEEGVLFGEFSANNTDTDSNWINISDGTNSNWLFIGKDSAQVRAYLKADGNIIFSDTTTPLADNNKVALSYKSGDVRLYINGVETLNLTNSFAFSSDLNQLNFNGYTGGAINSKTSWKQVRVFNTTLTQAELITLTTI